MLFMKRYMCNIADMCLNLGVDDRDDDVRSGRGEYWPHDVAASLSSLPPTLPRTAGKGEGRWRRRWCWGRRRRRRKRSRRRRRRGRGRISTMRGQEADRAGQEGHNSIHENQLYATHGLPH